jgi:hypothetical protein
MNRHFDYLQPLDPIALCEERTRAHGTEEIF